MTGGDVPDLSVVVAATDSPRAADRAVRALAGPARGPVEILVVDGFGADGSDPPCGARRIAAPPGSGVPRLRRLGLEAATGRVVAFTEDSCLAAPGWADAWMAAFEDPALAAASGVVEHGLGASTLDWAVVFCEYAPFLPPTPPGPPDRLAGNNFAAPRALALRGSAAEVHETALLAAVRRDPGATRTVDRAVVHHVRRFDPGRAIGDRLRSGLEYGWLRARHLRGSGGPLAPGRPPEPAPPRPLRRGPADHPSAAGRLERRRVGGLVAGLARIPGPGPEPRRRHRGRGSADGSGGIVPGALTFRSASVAHPAVESRWA